MSTREQSQAADDQGPAASGSRLTVFYVVLALADGGRDGRGRVSDGPGREGRSRRSPAATTPTRPNACLGTPPAPVEGPAASRHRAGHGAGRRALLRRQAVGPVREPLELPGARSAASCASRTSERRRRAARSPATSTASNGKTQRSSRARRPPATRPSITGDARRPARSPPTCKRDPPDAGTPEAARAGLDRRRSTGCRRARPASAATSSSRAAARTTSSRRRGRSSASSSTTRRRARSPATSSACAGGEARLQGAGRRPQHQQPHAASRSTRPSPARHRDAEQAGAHDALRARARRASASPPPSSASRSATRRRVLHRGRRRDARRAPVRHAGGQARAAARDGRGRGRHHARPDASSARSRPSLQAALFPTDILPCIRGGGQPRPDLLHVPRRPGARPEPAQGPRSARRRRSRTPASRCR